MCDLVDDETRRIESRFLEPACGDGNFLEEILRRKLAIVRKSYRHNNADYERFSLLVLTSLYGVDIMPDNIRECQHRLYVVWNRSYTAKLKKDASDKCRNVAKFILSRNILCGDALTMRQNDGAPIVFTEWTMVGNRVKRKDYELSGLLDAEVATQNNAGLAVSLSNWDYSKLVQNFIPKPIKQYSPVWYLEIGGVDG